MSNVRSRPAAFAALTLLALTSCKDSDVKAEPACRSVQMVFGINEPKRSQLKALLTRVSCPAVRLRETVMRIPDHYEFEFGTTTSGLDKLENDLVNISISLDLEVHARCIEDRCFIHPR